MKKFILAETGEEVKMGDTIKGIKKIETSFGTIKSIELIVVSRDNVINLMNRGIIKCIDKKPIDKKLNIVEDDTNNIGFYIKCLSTKYSRSVEDIIDWLNTTNKICPKAVLDILLAEIALHFYRDDVEGFDNSKAYYSLRLKNGEVGKVVNPSKYTPLFKSYEDAEKAREILKKQLEFMYGKQENC